jgi:hypothetical protein
MLNRKPLLATILVAGLFTASCSSTGETKPPVATTGTKTTSATPETDPAPAPSEAPVETTADTTTVTEPADTTTPEVVSVDQRGVTDDSINIGVSMVDFEALRKLGLKIPDWGDQELIWNTLIDDINANGGVLGRQVKATYAKYNPIQQAEAEAACVALAEDVETFIVLQGFTGPAAPANACLADKGVAQFSTSPDPAVAATIPWVSAEATESRRVRLLGNLLIANKVLDGKKFGIVAYEDAKPTVDANLIPVLADAGFTATDTFYSTLRGGDQQALDAEVAVWVEKMAADGIEHLIFVDDGTGFIGDIAAAGYTGTNSTDWGELNLAGDAALPGVDNHLAGTLTILPSPDPFQAARVKECIATFSAAHPDIEILDPKTFPGDADAQVWATGIMRACYFLDLFVAAMNAAGSPTNDALLDAIKNKMPSFSFGQYEFASFGPDKFDANNGFAPAEWDPTVGAGGAYVPTGPVVDLSK